MARKKQLVLILVICCGALWGCSKHHATQYQGWVENRLIYVASPTSGILKKLNISRGQKVTSGQQLYQLDLSPEQYALTKSKSQLTAEKQQLENLTLGSRQTILSSLKAQQAQAKAVLNLQTENFQRSKKLHSNHSISLAQFQQSQSDYATAKFKLKQITADIAEANLGARKSLIKAQQQIVAAAVDDVKTAQWNLDQKTVKADLDATVFDTLFRPGEFVAAGQPVLSLLSPANTQIIFFIPETILASTHVGQPIYFSLDGKSKALPGIIRYIYPQVEYTPPVIYSKSMQKKLVFRVEASVSKKNALQLNPGQPVSVALQPDN